jgi:membrane protease subunit HflC
MKAERLAEAELYSSTRPRKLRGVSARLPTARLIEIVCRSRSVNAEILRGEGDAERNRDLSPMPSTRDPEFFEFYRSMNAYSQSLTDSGTTMVLSPTSEFFRYFNNSASSVGAAAPATPASATAPAAPAADTGN